MSVRVTDRTLGMAVFGLILGTASVLDVMAFALLALHDPVDAALRTVLMVVVEVMSELPLLTFAVTLVDVAASVATTPVLVKVDA
jgi:ABC-type amino acid transport system permease subunit